MKNKQKSKGFIYDCILFNGNEDECFIGIIFWIFLVGTLILGAGF